ncbi:mitochondrial ribonuclease P catalytic subunit-like [Chrysoperla carnea]|uniref:mitochondrial ribonuclease P catalytic subunit-like n=1 Tax=Chrysoperla carnea TaxID=189513 RepID=UPI001D07D7C3|nr:mitochondrial ribonuclease P catalytic subunit-like [Chrysoperla carnea]
MIAISLILLCLFSIVQALIDNTSDIFNNDIMDLVYVKKDNLIEQTAFSTVSTPENGSHPEALALQASNREADYGGHEQNYYHHDHKYVYDKKKDKGLSHIFQIAVTALAFLAFGGYLLCLIVQAVKSKTQMNAAQMAATQTQTIIRRRRRRKPIRLRPLRRPKRDTYFDDEDLWENANYEDLYYALTTFSEGYAQDRLQSKYVFTVTFYLIHSISKELRDLNPDWLTLAETVIGFCIQDKRLDIAKTYFEYLKTEKIQLNNAFISKLLRLYYVCYNEAAISKEIEIEIINLCSLFEKKFDLLDAFSSENAILGLSLTSNWKQCLEHLNNIKLTGIAPNALVYSTIIAAAFINNDLDVAWELLREMIDNDREPTSRMYYGLLKFCENNVSKSVEILDNLFQILSNSDIKPPKEYIDKLIGLKKQFKLSGKLTKITKMGKCYSCGNSLSSMTLSQDEFNLLRTSFYTNVMVGKNVYTKTTPKELENFQKFFTTVEPFNIVIDGLNVAYSAGIKHTPETYCRLIAGVIKYFTDQQNRVLVLGRAHMSKWKNIHMSQILKTSTLYLVQNLSQDDPFLLYAAMHNGPKTGFVSRDLMRGHSYRLKDPNLKMLFRRWQNNVQHQLIYLDNQGNARVKHPLPYVPIAQKQETYWHIPFEINIENKSKNISSKVNSIQWACFKMPS